MIKKQIVIKDIEIFQILTSSATLASGFIDLHDWDKVPVKHYNNNKIVVRMGDKEVNFKIEVQAKYIPFGKTKAMIKNIIRRVKNKLCVWICKDEYYD